MYAGAPAAEVAAVLTTFDPERRHHGRAPQVADVDEERGLRRSMAFDIGDGVVRPVVHYHATSRTGTLASCSGRPAPRSAPPQRACALVIMKRAQRRVDLVPPVYITGGGVAATGQDSGEVLGVIVRTRLYDAAGNRL